MKEKKVVLFVLLGIILSLVGIGGASYSLYKSSPRGRTSGAIANWNFTVNNSKDTFSIDLAKNANNVNNGKLAPGSYGSFDIKLDASSTDVDVNYKITFNNLKGKPDNLNFYLDSAYTRKIELDKDAISDVIKFGDNMVKNVTIYWKWDYNGSADDNMYQNSILSFDIVVVGSQIN